MSNRQPMKRKTYRLQVAAEETELRLDQFLAARCDGISRGVIRKLVDLGAAHVKGRRTRKCSLSLRAGDRVDFYIDGLPLTPYRLTADAVVFQDRHLLVVNKPAGIDCQPTPSRYKGTMYDAVTDYLKDPLRKDLRPSIGMVQRLDRDTSGLMVFSIHQAAHKEMTRIFAQRDVIKRYRVLVEGRMEEPVGTFHTQLARRRATNSMKSVARGGQEAITHYRLIEATDQVSYLEVEIETGRSHQIRAHFSEAGHPLLGDTRYGGGVMIGDIQVGRHMLHSHAIAFRHPVTREQLSFEVDLPVDMKTVVEKIFGPLDA